MGAGEIAGLRRDRKEPEFFEGLGRPFVTQDRPGLFFESGSEARGCLLRLDRDDVGVAIMRSPVLGGLQDFYAAESGFDEFGQKRLF